MGNLTVLTLEHILGLPHSGISRPGQGACTDAAQSDWSDRAWPASCTGYRQTSLRTLLTKFNCAVLLRRYLWRKLQLYTELVEKAGK